VISALEDKLRTMPRPLDRAKIAEICARMDALPVLDDRTPDEIIGYDEFGIPR
jgi:antitoxin VapB